ncbi:ribonuclease H [Senna tora]|uniref:Ribonuclease H n=1 Tax=Senna tora TaxID=362788 RepID=A0A834TJL5_9FABA|nr:ribonuclease H [Senna tora]
MKPPDYKESLDLLKIGEKNFRNSGQLLSNLGRLGLQYVYALVKDIFNIYNTDILALVETRTSGSRADAIISKCGIPYFIRVEAYGYSRGIRILWRRDEIGISIEMLASDIDNSPWLVLGDFNSILSNHAIQIREVSNVFLTP